jgi:hypothetical protein
MLYADSLNKAWLPSNMVAEFLRANPSVVDPLIEAGSV